MLYTRGTVCQNRRVYVQFRQFLCVLICYTTMESSLAFSLLCVHGWGPGIGTATIPVCWSPLVHNRACPKHLNMIRGIYLP
ncbi:hypothetical protein BDU57DRAFT_520295 [Ampelomyces quisqualis]|uniref:Uncharacterized protein n=1 Tax=Ampelomyces quisqualis TaxID=50730 RepID=A0A6A5QLT6_AMPQU|nr:hypothetical protein BDU57DRAFT_520295 [Ampelomyces quisqualis]